MKDEKEKDVKLNLSEERRIYMQTIRCLDETTEDYFFFYDLVSDRIYFTDKICKKYSIAAGEEGISFSELQDVVFPRDFRQLEKNIREIRDGKKDYHQMEYRLIDCEGNNVWVSGRGQVRKDETGRPAIIVGNISELALGRLVDSLTGLWNSEKFMEDMGKCLRKNGGYLMVFGIDNFKDINVKNGRTYGNFLLRRITDILEENSDLALKLYRMYGDRFAVNFPQKTKWDVMEFYSILKGALEQYCTISAGVVTYHSGDGEDSGTVYQYAENALDRAKREGKNTLVFFSAEDFQKSLDNIELQDELKHSVEEGCKGFFLCYQPQVSGTDFSIYGAEALLRYESETRGLVSPVEFIPHLEKSGLICPVGNWVLKTAVEQCVQWRKTIPDLHMNVNVSYVQLQQENITETVLNILKEAGLPGEALTLEVTESMQLQDYSYYNKIFCEWKRQGIKIAIDDFGTGYSSLSYLKSIDINETKIDRCFVNRIHYNAYNYRLLSNMIELAHSAEIQVCCEGVETEEELMALQELSPDVLQGFLFARPCKKSEFEKSYIIPEEEEYRTRVRRENDFRQIAAKKGLGFMDVLRKDEILNIVEGLDEVIYVSDVDTYSIYYLNPAGRKLTGCDDYKGRKCYEVLQGWETPCEFCSNKRLSKDEFRVWELENKFFGKRFLVKDRLIPWQGKMARMEMAIDISKQRREGSDSRSQLYKTANRGLDQSVSRHFEDVLNNTKLGLWMIRIDPDTGKGEMFADEVMNWNMGLDKPLPPEDCYLHWYNRINDGYYTYVNLAVENIIQTGKLTQLEYTWNHPYQGEVMVRCMGVRVKDSDGMICMQGYHRMISDLERPYFLPEGLNSETFEFNENKQAIYFHTSRRMLYGEARKETAFPECWIRNQIVHPHFVGVFREMFTSVKNQENMQGKELLLRAKSGKYEWFKLKTRHLSSGEQDANTIIVIVDPADRERTIELEYMRKSDFYEALLSETAAYAEVDIESGYLTAVGGLWKAYEEEFMDHRQTFDMVFERHIREVVCEEDVEEYWKCLDRDNIKKLYRSGIKTKKYSFRRYVDGELCWMEIMIHVFQDRFTENMYALLYLKNIDADKKREIAQESAAQRDPLTNVYNRSIFENEVENFMQTKGADMCGALIILDLDDFKKVNDHFGHLKGDETLKALTKILRSTFRSHDLIGRLGGDEFLVFVKGVASKEVLNRRMDDLFERLKNSGSIPLACSAGISMLTGEDFAYEKALKRADIALYKSKEKGKNCYSYYED